MKKVKVMTEKLYYAGHESNGNFSKLSSRMIGLKVISCWWWSSGMMMGRWSRVLWPNLQVECQCWIWRNRCTEDIMHEEPIFWNSEIRNGKAMVFEWPGIHFQATGDILLWTIFHCKNSQNWQKEWYLCIYGCHMSESVGHRKRWSNSIWQKGWATDGVWHGWTYPSRWKSRVTGWNAMRVGKWWGNGWDGWDEQWNVMVVN